LNGTKYYSTGALYADALSISAINDHGDLVMVQLPADAPGVELRDDWNGIGQRLTGSGTTVLTDVVVEEGQVGVMKARRAPTASNDIFEDGPTGGLTAAACTGFHAALTVGIARAAFEDGVWFLREKARPWVYTGIERAADEPLLLKIEGELQTQLHAAEALLERAARLVDRAYQTLTAADVLAARVAVAEAKAFGSEAGLRIASDIFTLGGTGSTDRKYNLDRHWRNLRTHETHDATRWLYFHVGNALVNNAAPPATGKI
jgi:alkylation response protein AidB-like acyl-CoA dehydrogenase